MFRIDRAKSLRIYSGPRTVILSARNSILGIEIPRHSNRNFQQPIALDFGRKMILAQKADSVSALSILSRNNDLIPVLRQNPIIQRMARDVQNEDDPGKIAAFLNSPIWMVRQELAKREDLSVDTLARLLGDKSRSVRETARTNPITRARVHAAISTTDLEQARLHAVSPIYLERAALVNNKFIIEDKQFQPILLEMAQKETHWFVINAFKESPAITKAILDAWAGNENILVRYMPAAHPKTPIDTLTKLAGETDLNMKKLIAGNTKASARLIDQINLSVDNYINENIYIPKDAPVDYQCSYLQLAALIKTICSIKESAARNVKTSQETLSKLLLDSTKLLLVTVENNTILTEEEKEQLHQLIDLSAFRIKLAAAGNPHITPGGAATIISDCRGFIETILRDKTTAPIADIQKFMRVNCQIHESIAGNSLLSDGDIDLLIKDYDELLNFVDNSLFIRPKDRDNLVEFIIESSFKTKKVAGGNPSVSPSTITAILDDIDECYKAMRRMQTFNAIGCDYLMRTIFKIKEAIINNVKMNHSEFSKTVFSRLSCDVDVHVRQRISSLSDERNTLEYLSNDGDLSVRYTAKEKLELLAKRDGI